MSRTRWLIMGSALLPLLSGCHHVTYSKTKTLAPSYAGVFGLFEKEVARSTQQNLRDLPAGAPCVINLVPTERGLIHREYDVVEGQVAEVTDQGVRLSRAQATEWHQTSVVVASYATAYPQEPTESVWIPKEQIANVSYQAGRWKWDSETSSWNPIPYEPVESDD